MWPRSATSSRSTTRKRSRSRSRNRTESRLLALVAARACEMEVLLEEPEQRRPSRPRRVFVAPDGVAPANAGLEPPSVDDARGQSLRARRSGRGVAQSLAIEQGEAMRVVLD